MVCTHLPTDIGFMVIGDTHASLVVALLPALFPQAVVLTKRQGRAPLTVDRGPSVHRTFKNILDSIIRGKLPHQLGLALDRLVHRQLETLVVEPLKHLPDAPEFA